MNAEERAEAREQAIEDEIDRLLGMAVYAVLDEIDFSITRNEFDKLDSAIADALSWIDPDDEYHDRIIAADLNSLREAILAAAAMPTRWPSSYPASPIADDARRLHDAIEAAAAAMIEYRNLL